jgi:hypothetical protein
MIKSKAIELLKTFSPKEFREFGDFIRSPFFNKNPKQVLLYEALKQYYPGFNSEKLTKEKIYSILYSGKKYKDNEVRRALSENLNLGEQYLSFAHIKNDEKFLIKKSLLKQLDSRKLDKLFNALLNELYDEYGSNKEIDDDYFIRNFDIQVLKTNFDQGKLPSKESRNVTINNLVACFKYLIGFSAITALKLNQDFIAMNVNYNFDNKNTLAYKYIEKLNLKGFLEDVKSEDESLYSILSIYYTHFLIMAGFDKDDSHYHALKNLVYENIDLFSRFEKYNLMLFLETCASVKIKDGKTSFVSEIHEIHKYMLRKNLYGYSDSNYLHIVRFWKIINNSIALKKYGWTEDFINEYSQKLHPQSMNHMRNYAYSLLSFAKRDYEKSLEHAAKVKSYDYNISFGVKSIKLKCYLELGYSEEAFYLTDSIKHSLARDINSPDWAKRRFENFIDCFEKLLKLKINLPAGKFEINLFKEELEASEDLSEKQWLIDKLSLLN